MEPDAIMKGPAVNGSDDRHKEQMQKKPKPYQEGDMPYRKKWEETLNGTISYRSIKTNSERLSNDIMEYLSKEADKEIIKEGIKRFICDKAMKIDSCVRWLMLSHIISHLDDDDDDGANDQLLLIQIICEIDATIPFINIYSPLTLPGDSPYTVCKLEEHKPLRKKAKEGSMPFYSAIQEGNAKVAKCMLECLEKLKKSPPPGSSASALVTHFPRQNPSSQKTALEEIVDSDNPNADLLDVLLSSREITSSPGESFQNAIKKGLVGVVDKFLEIPTIRDRYVTSDQILQALSNISSDPSLEVWSISNRENKEITEPETKHEIREKMLETREHQIKLVNSLIKKVKSEDVNGKIINKIIELNLVETWASIPEEAKIETDNLLHLAVYHRKIQFVELFLEKYKSSVTTKAALYQIEGIKYKDKEDKDKENRENHHYYYPLWYNKKRWNGSSWVTNDPEGSKDAEKIRTAIVTATIKQVEKMRVLSDILQESSEKVREICFDISQFSSKNHGVDEFVYTLINHRESSDLLSYEQTIKYARFPSLEDNIDNQQLLSGSISKDHKEVFDVLDWLKDQKKVTSIVELKVPDRMFKPHNELRIADYVQSFEVESLDWRFLDLSLAIFNGEVRNRIKELHLYASGKRVAIDHWLSSEGIQRFPALVLLHIHLVPEMMTREYLSKNKRLLNDTLTELGGNRKLSQGLKWKVTQEPWNPSRGRQASLEEIAQKAFPRLYPFIKSYQTYHQEGAVKMKSYRPTRIAIIDNGIMNMPHVSGRQANKKTSSKQSSGSDRKYNGERANNNESNTDWNDTTSSNQVKEHKTLWDRIRVGCSFVDDGNHLSQWMFASDPHGTQMANLICAIDPKCELYVAKVTDGRFGITPERVARAIRWAINMDVDIISMSFVILEESEELKGILEEAATKKDIIILCSAHDEGARASEAWPAASEHTTTIAACNEYGVELRGTTTSCKWKLHGENIAAGTVPFLESTEHVTGSSAATAIAAGLSSLILSCYRLVKGMEERRALRKETVDAYFRQLQSTQTSNYVLLEKFGRIDVKVREGEPIDAKTIIHQWF